jgi:transcriptional regulator with XRE-family HTH domain
MDKREFLNKLGENVVKLRSEKNWSQSDLARACFKDRQSVERFLLFAFLACFITFWENNKVGSNNKKCIFFI